MASAEQWALGGVSRGQYPAPVDVDRYAKKPLPPLPLDRSSVASSSSSEVGHAFVAPKTATQNEPFIFDWEVESPGRSVRLGQSLGPDDLTPMRLRLRRHSLSAVGSDPAIVSITPATTHRADPSSDGLQWRIVRAAAVYDLRARLAHRHSVHTVPIHKIIIPTVPPDEILSPQPKSSVQKILKLTGNMSPTTSLSTDTPSLHSSRQKIRQLTGLDFGPRRGSESQLQTVQEDMSIASSEVSPSLYKHDMPEDISYETAESIYSHSCAGSIDEVCTPLAAAPRYFSAVSPPARYCPPRDDNLRAPAKEALHLSGFIAADFGVTTPGERAPIAGRQQSWSEHNGEEELHSSSSSEISESEFEMELTVAELYHHSAAAIVKNSPVSKLDGGGHGEESLSSKLRGISWDSKHQISDTVPNRHSRSSTQGSISSTIGSTLSQSPSASSPFTFKPFRKKDTLSDRRGHIPSPLGSVASSPSSRGKQPQRTPYPPVSSSIRATVEEAENGQARLSLLTRIFTTGNGSSSASLGRRDSTASGVSAAASAKFADKTKTITPTASAWSPETPSPGTTTFGAASRHSAGLLAWTMDHARHAAGRKSKADKAETKRGSLKGKIKVLRSGAGSTTDLDKLSSLGS